jgi:Cu+-exporting ATPase
MNLQTITFKVKDMHCPSCPRLIQQDLEDKPGVVAVNANLETNMVVVEYDPHSINNNELINTIKESGYIATIL